MTMPRPGPLCFRPSVSLGRDDGDDAQAVELRPGDRAGVDLPRQDGVLAGQAGVGVGEARAGEDVAGAGLDVLAANGAGVRVDHEDDGQEQ